MTLAQLEFPKEVIQNGRISIFLDNNVWDFFHENCINLCEVFSSNWFNISVTKHVEFESAAISSPGKETLKSFIDNTMESCVTVRSYFGFFDDRFSESQQRAGGGSCLFNSNRCGGEFSNLGAEAFRKELIEMYPQSNDVSKIKKSGMMPNETDIDLAVRSMNAIVLTCDCKPGPLKIAAERGHFVVFLNDYTDKSSCLLSYICSKLPLKTTFST